MPVVSYTDEQFYYHRLWVEWLTPEQATALQELIEALAIANGAPSVRPSSEPATPLSPCPEPPASGAQPTEAAQG